MSLSEDMEAINRYVSGMRIPVGRPEAENLQQAWKAWYKNLGWFDKNLSKDVFKQAQDRRAAFNRSLGTPENPRGVTKAQIEKGENIGPSVNVTNMTPVERISAIWNYKLPIRSNTTVKWPSTGTPPVLVSGVRNSWVKEWQRILGITQTGVFDANTVQATKSWQTAHGLKADGKVGSKTWTMVKDRVGEKPPEVLDSLKEAVSDAITSVVKPIITPGTTPLQGSRSASTKSSTPTKSTSAPAASTASKKPAQGTVEAALTPSGSTPDALRDPRRGIMQAGMFGTATTLQKVTAGLLIVGAMIFSAKARKGEE